MARIVVLDDQIDICLAIKARLVKDGHDVRTSLLGDEAIDFGYLFEPEILITDWRLECEYDGLEVAKAFRFALPKIKTILISGFPIEILKTRSENLEIFKTIAKPFSMEVISQVVSDALEPVSDCS